MTDVPLDLCVDAYPPGERYDPATLPRPVDPGVSVPEELALARRKQWQAGQELRVRFVDGDRGIRHRVQEHAEEWTAHANLSFGFGNQPGAEIRVSFQGCGYWSLVGTDARRADLAAPTMQLGGLDAETDDRVVRRVVLHEFGHAIGCVHEQASPAAAIPWDVPKVYAYYRRWQGWDDETIRRNVLLRYGADRVRFSGFDRYSIMQYPVPAELTLDGTAIGWNDDLSDGDKAFVARLYPR